MKVYFGSLFLFVAFSWISTGLGAPAPSPSVRDEYIRIMSDYPSIVPPVWPEATNLPTLYPLNDDLLAEDDAFGASSDGQNPSRLMPIQSSGVTASRRLLPSDFPSAVPSDFPSAVPSDFPSDVPSMVSSDIPSMVPSDVPSTVPSFFPSDMPSSVPSSFPSSTPSDSPSKTSESTLVFFDLLGVEPFQDFAPPNMPENDSLPEVPASSMSRKGKRKMRRAAALEDPEKLPKATIKRWVKENNDGGRLRNFN